jgi:uncharacterized protein
MRPVYRSNLFMLTVVLGQIFGSVFLSKPLYKFFEYSQVLVLSQVIFLLVPVIIYLIVTKTSLKDTLRFNKISFMDMVAIIAIAVLSQPIATFLSALSSMFFKNVVNDLFKEMGTISYITQLGIIALIPAVCEELTIRGVVLSGYEKVSRGKAALSTGFFFGILHLNLQQFFYAFALGILFAYLVRITNSIFSTMLCHFTFNGIQVTMSYIVSKVNPESLDQAMEIVNMPINNKIMLLLPYFIWAVICTYVVIWIMRKMEERRNTISRGQVLSTINHGGSASEIDYTMPHLIRRTSSYKEERIVNGPFIAVVVVFILMMILMKYLRQM